MFASDESRNKSLRTRDYCRWHAEKCVTLRKRRRDAIHRPRTALYQFKKEDPNYRLSSNYLRLNSTVAHAFRVLLQRHDLFAPVVESVRLIHRHYQHLESLVDFFNHWRLNYRRPVFLLTYLEISKFRRGRLAG